LKRYTTLQLLDIYKKLIKWAWPKCFWHIDKNYPLLAKWKCERIISSFAWGISVYVYYGIRWEKKTKNC